MPTLSLAYHRMYWMPGTVIERSIARRKLDFAQRSSLILLNCHRRDVFSSQFQTDKAVMDELKQIARTKQALDRSTIKPDRISAEYSAHKREQYVVHKRFTMLVMDKAVGAINESESPQKLRQEGSSGHEQFERSLAEIESLVQQDAATLHPELDREQRMALGKLVNEVRSVAKTARRIILFGTTICGILLWTWLS